MQRFVRDRRNPFELCTQLEFEERFGFHKEPIIPLFNLCTPYLRHDTDFNHALSPEMQVLCGLRIFRSGCTRLVGSDLVNVHRTTAGRAFHRLVNCLADIKDMFIKMPTRDECPQKKNAFYQLGGFPNVIGAIDCTHVPILCLRVRKAEIYRNGKGVFSLNTQVI